MQGKVFGIGLSRTGTKSLSQATALLGYRTAHFVEHLRQERGRATWFAGSFEVDDLADCDAAIDLPIPIFYPQLDERYPGSKFILTIRDQSSWLRSMRRQWERWHVGLEDAGSYRKMVRLAAYGVFGRSDSRLSFSYETHIRNVLWYFRDRPEDLLTVDICGGEGWGKLCAFLEKPIPAAPFPWANRSDDVQPDTQNLAGAA